MSWHGTHPKISAGAARRALPPGACRRCVYYFRVYRDAPHAKCSRCGIVSDRLRVGDVVLTAEGRLRLVIDSHPGAPSCVYLSAHALTGQHATAYAAHASELELAHGPMPAWWVELERAARVPLGLGFEP